MTQPVSLRALAQQLSAELDSELRQHVALPGRELPIVDATSRPCPYPVLQAAKFARSLPARTAFLLVASDPASSTDVPAWCRMSRHLLVAAQDWVPAQGNADEAAASMGALSEVANLTTANSETSATLDAAPGTPCQWFCVVTPGE